MTAWIALFFAWPTGGVWSNLVASVITGLAVWLWARRSIASLHRKVDRQHREITAQNAELRDEARAHHDRVSRHLGIPDTPESE